MYEVMNLSDSKRDKELGIKTVGVREFLTSSRHHNRYEATPYEALDELCLIYRAPKNTRLVDFGCGKGRVPFYFYHYENLDAVGVEVSPILYIEAIQNIYTYRQKHKKNSKKASTLIRFESVLAENYPIHSQDGVFYFFNPFSTTLFREVLHNILDSIEQTPRQVDLIFYFPNDQYIQTIESYAMFKLLYTIRLKQLFPNEPRERFLVYRFTP